MSIVLQAYKATQTAPRLQRQKDPSGRSVSNYASEDSLGKTAPRLSRVGVRLEVRGWAFVALSWWSEHIVRPSCVFLAHQNLKPRAGPRKVFTHSSRRVSLHHCLNASIFERTLGQVRLSATTVRLDDNKPSVLHSNIIRPDER